MNHLCNLRKTNILIILTVTAALLTLTALLSVSSYAGSEIYSSGYFYYTVKDDSVTITGYFGPETETAVPDSIAGYPVSTIATGAFKDSKKLKTIHLPDTIMTIERDAFKPDQKIIYDRKEGTTGSQDDENGSDNGSGAGTVSQAGSDSGNGADTSKKSGNNGSSPKSIDSTNKTDNNSSTDKTNSTNSAANNSSASGSIDSTDDLSIDEREDSLEGYDMGTDDQEAEHGPRRTIGCVLLAAIAVIIAAGVIYYIRMKGSEE